MTKVQFKGENRYLNYSVGVMIEVNRKYGSLDDFLEKLNSAESTDEGFDAFRFAFVMMANDAEQKIEHDGYERLAPISLDDLPKQLQPMVFVRLWNAVVEEINTAYDHEYTEEEQKEIDLGLAEIRKKKESPEKPQTRTIITSD